MTKIVILYTDAGGGHKSTALSLQEIVHKYTDWQVQLINPFTELCAEFDIANKIFSTPAEDLYNKYVSKNHSALIKMLIISGIFIINVLLYRSKIVRKLTGAWKALQPNMIISVTPFINSIIAESLQRLPQPLPFITLITDYHECVRNVWITAKQQKVICCSEKLATHAIARGVLKQNVFRLSGLLVACKFYDAMQMNKNELRKQLGLQAGVPTVIVAFGSHGSPDMLAIAKNLRKFPSPLQVIFICGHNERLQSNLNKMQVDYSVITTGFVNNVEQYMRCADLLIGKPGGISVAEASVMHLPMILKYNIFTLIHERHNAQWVVENKLGITVRNFGNIQQAVQDVLKNTVQFRASLNALNNQGYYEILPILEEILGIRSHTLQQTLSAANALG